MARRLFFSFDYDQDIFRVNQIRNAPLTVGTETLGFMDTVDWEAVKHGGAAEIQRWIDQQLVGTSVTAALVGTVTASSRWVGRDMSKSLFISYVYEDRAHRDSVERWIKTGKLGAEFVAVTESGDHRSSGDAAVRQHLEPLIRGCGAVVCLVGRDTHNHEWVQWELSVASSLGKKIVLLGIPETKGAAPTHHRHLSVHPFDPGTLKKLL